MRLTVIPSDSTIILDGVPLTFPFAAPADVHAIQWNGVKGTIERTDFSASDIVDAALVQPYLDAYAAEKARLTPPAPTLGSVKLDKLAAMDAAYNTAVQMPVAYMGTTFQADTESQAILTSTLVALNATGSVPAGFGWWDINNVKVQMTLAELNGLAGAMLAQGWVAFQHKQAKKDAARAAASIAEVDAVTW